MYIEMDIGSYLLGLLMGVIFTIFIILSIDMIKALYCKIRNRQEDDE